MNNQTMSFGFLTLVVFSALLMIDHPAPAQEALLHTFGLSPSDGWDPQSSLTFDSAGNLYGTTVWGGQYGYGTVFKLSAGTWDETVLYNFTGGSDGSCYNAGNGAGCSNLIFDGAGNLYGTAPAGGRHDDGVVFELSPAGANWSQTVLHSFGGSGDGIYAIGGVIMDKGGNLYGTTDAFYYQNDIPATVYELSPSGGAWTESIIYVLPTDNESDSLNGGLTMDAEGNIYGSSLKTVFELKPNGQGGWNPIVIHNLTGYPKDAFGTGAPLVLDSAGNLYGVTTGGGSKNDGAVYKLIPQKRGKWTDKILYSFTTPNPCCPWYFASVVLDGVDNLYGTAGDGGSLGDGMVYELMAPVGAGAYKEKTLFSFNGKDGSVPFASLIFDSAGNLYGTTSGGGFGCSGTCGVAFELNPSATVTTTTLMSFPNPSTNGEPVNFTAMVTPAPSNGETIRFTDGTNVLGTGTLSGGVATLSYSALPVGASKITAIYAGDLALDGSTSNTVKQVVKK